MSRIFQKLYIFGVYGTGAAAFLETPSILDYNITSRSHSLQVQLMASWKPMDKLQQIRGKTHFFKIKDRKQVDSKTETGKDWCKDLLQANIPL